MGRASSRPRSRRASGRACFASTDAFVDVAGITAERAAEGSGSEWSSEEKEEEKETEVVPPGPRPEGVVGVDADAPLSDVPAPSTPASIRAATRRASRRLPPPATSRGSTETREPAVRVFLFTNEKGLETARPVTARLVVARPAGPHTREVTYGDVLRADSPHASTAPLWIGSIAERLAGHAGAWPAWDIRRSAKGKTLVATQLEDFANAVPYTPTEPRHDEEARLSTKVSSQDPSSCPPIPPMPWSFDLGEADRAARWRYEGGGMHQPVAEATPAERWVETHKRKGNGGVSAVTASALETNAEVALAVDGERALSPRAAAAAAELARAAREAGPLALSRRKRAKTPPASDTRLPLPAASLAASAGTSSKTFKTEADASVEKEKHTGTAAFSSAEASKLWGAWSPSVQRRRRRRLDAARVGGDDDAGDDDDDALTRGKPLPLNPKAESGVSGVSGACGSASTFRVGSFPKADGFSGRSSGYEEEDDPPADSDDASSKTSSDFETPAATRAGTPTRDEEETC